MAVRFPIQGLGIPSTSQQNIYNLVQAVLNGNTSQILQYTTSLGAPFVMRVIHDLYLGGQISLSSLVNIITSVATNNANQAQEMLYYLASIGDVKTLVQIITYNAPSNNYANTTATATQTFWNNWYFDVKNSLVVGPSATYTEPNGPAVLIAYSIRVSGGGTPIPTIQVNPMNNGGVAPSGAGGTGYYFNIGLQNVNGSAGTSTATSASGGGIPGGGGAGGGNGSTAGGNGGSTSDVQGFPSINQFIQTVLKFVADYYLVNILKVTPTSTTSLPSVYGGGGGAGTSGNGGGGGSGFIIVTSNIIISNGQIIANGQNGQSVSSGGAGGGGGGGQIYIITNEISMSLSSISANGGNGGSTSGTGNVGGGGGGGGQIFILARIISLASSGVSTNTNAGSGGSGGTNGGAGQSSPVNIQSVIGTYN